MGVIKKRGITYAGGGGGELPDYSTIEHMTGRKWIDGRDVWEVVINKPSTDVLTLTSDAWVATNISITGWGMSEIIGARLTGNNAVFAISASPLNNLIYLNSPRTLTLNNGWQLIVEYLKSS